MSVRFWVVIPAAGSGRRMSAAGRPHSTPKQYLPLAGRTVIEWAVAPLLEHPGCQAACVVLAADDEQWQTLPVSHEPRICIARGGAERADSVRAGLAAVAAPVAVRPQCGEDDWVLVHDAARPCLSMTDLQHLLDSLHADPVGGLLAAPLVDTLKRADAAQRVAQTLSREALWRAQTPQMFRCGLLQRALAAAATHGLAVTDESQAVELAGHQPKLVAGHPDNLKITVSADLQQAERILRARGAPP
jgi:2-C-methyl-D-erythritol 4-phosphate cytidylyltransferase